jgi:hypothetical protein
MSAINDTTNRDLFAFNYQPSTNLLAKVRSISILGENLDIDSGSVPETMWERGGPYPFPTVATPVTVTSSSDQDKYLTGAGAWLVLIEGLDENYKEQIETLTMAGSAVVASAKSYLRVNALRSVYHGSNKVANGTITATVASSVIRQISASSSIDYTAVFSVPAEHSFFPQAFSHNVLKLTTASITVTTKVYVPDTNGIVTASFLFVGGSQPTIVSPTNLAFSRVPEKCDFWIDIAYASTTNLEASTLGRGLLVKNDFIPAYP